LIILGIREVILIIKEEEKFELKNKRDVYGHPMFFQYNFDT